MRHLIIEGPDGAGKTTLAKRMCRDFDLAYHHEGPPPAGVKLLAHYGRLLADASVPTVFDRFHLGELVYGPLLRGESGLTAYDVRLLKRLIQATNTRIIACLPEFEVCLANTRNRSELIKSDDVMRTAYDAWTAVIDAHPEQLLRFDYTQAESIDTRQASNWLPAGVIGSPGARILFVGEQVNGELDLPFFGSGPSSTYLNTALAEAGVREHDLALVNALDRAGRPADLAHILYCLPRCRRIVALGKVALTQLEARLDLTGSWRERVAAIPHPSHWRRFHANERASYVQMIRSVYETA